MDNVRKSPKNNYNNIKQAKDKKKSSKIYSKKINPIIKYIQTLPSIHYTIDKNVELLTDRASPSPIQISEEPKLRNTLKYFNKNSGLTINNNTNLTNLNLYFVYNTEANIVHNNKPKIHNSKSVTKKKEPTDTKSKKNNYITNFDSKKQDKIINSNEKTQRYYSIRQIIKRNDSKSPRDNTNVQSIKKRKDLPKIKEVVEDNNINKKLKSEEIKITYLKDKKKPKDRINKNKINIIVNEEPKGDLNLSEFIKINQIGKGTFAKIYAVKWKITGKKYALKKETFNDMEFFEKRKSIANIMKDFCEKTNSNGVIKVYSSLCEKLPNVFNYYELMEIGERDWDQEIKLRRKKYLYYTEFELFNISKQLIKTLALLQRNHITHRDIKHQNILVVNGNYKLCDFGEIRYMKGNGIVVQRIRGSELFMSPILFYGLRADLIQVKHNTYKSDVFSLGMCLLYAATMHFDGTDEIRELIDMNEIKLSLEKYLKERYSDKFINLLLTMLQTNEDLRPDFEQLEKLIDSL